MGMTKFHIVYTIYHHSVHCTTLVSQALLELLLLEGDERVRLPRLMFHIIYAVHCTLHHTHITGPA